MGDHHHRSSDEMSLFLDQILLRSSSSSSAAVPAASSSLSSMKTTSSCSSFMGVQAQSFAGGGGPVCVQQESFCYDTYYKGLCGSNNEVKDAMLGLDLGDGVVHNNFGCLLGNVKGNASSSLSVGGAASENETDHECDCESEEGVEALVEGVQTKAAPPRSSSKRSRAAEVHNLSEKRRRSRINEKMKALQNLIPNSNKTDKASMLDEAIEYLKQLQLQVQMLSMRNGVSLHPMCLPGMLQPIQFSQFIRGYGVENGGSQHASATRSLPLNQENPEEIVFDLPNQCAVSNQLPVPNLSSVINSETSFCMESSIRAHFGPFSHHTSSVEICREDVLPHQLIADHSERIESEYEMPSTTTASIPFEKQASNLKDNNSLGACMIGRDQNECLFLKNMENSPIVSTSLQGMHRGRSTPDDEIKAEMQAI